MATTQTRRMTLHYHVATFDRTTASQRAWSVGYPKCGAGATDLALTEFGFHGAFAAGWQHKDSGATPCPKCAALLGLDAARWTAWS